MEWLNWFLPDLPMRFQWYMIVPGLLAYILLPLLTFYFFCRYCQISFRWLPGVCYMLFYAFVCVWEVAQLCVQGLGQRRKLNCCPQ